MVLLMLSSCTWASRQATWVSNLCARADTGAALGTFGGLGSLAELGARLGAGAVWQLAGPSWTFGVAAAVAVGVGLYLAQLSVAKELSE